MEETLMLGREEGRRRGGATGQKMVGWHRRLDAHESEQAPRTVRDREA